MPRPRKALVSLEATPYYHCSSRCVRRAFLCGTDEKSGQCFEHRRQWIEDKLIQLAGIFAIDLAAYAVMSNHYHVVLHVDRARAEEWSAQEVVRRWHQLFKGTPLTQRYSSGARLSRAEQVAVEELIDEWRRRLSDIGWFMRIINESVARAANKEDSCTGRFWEGRFSSQALLDEKALAACAVYVDLNPLRAKLAATPEQSDHTSVQRRLRHAQRAAQPNHPQQQAKGLLPFAGNLREPMPKGLPFRLADYLELVDWTGRIVRADKRGAIDTKLPPILDRLGIDSQQWLLMSTRFESNFKGLVGSVDRVREACELLGKKWCHGMYACREAFA